MPSFYAKRCTIFRTFKWLTKRDNHIDFISSLRCPECNDALRRVTARIDLDRIQKFLDGVPELQPIQREFYLTMLTERKEKILDYSLDLLLREEQQPGAPELTM